MTETYTREDRRSALDDFANSMSTEPAQALQTVASPPPAAQVFGAQAVAVRRDEARILQQIKVLATAAGTDWYYRYPVKDKGRTSWIEGPSIKLANDVARLYGNCEVDCRAQDLGSAIMFHARFVDLETGYALTRPFQQRKGASKLGGTDEGRREDITFQIGASKAIRNCVVNALQTFADFAFEEAKEALVEKVGKDIDKWRARTVERFSARIDLKRVEAVIGRTSDKWLAPDIARIIAMGKAVEDGMASMDETFPPLGTTPASTANEEAKIVDRLDAVAEAKVNIDAAAGPSASSGETATAEQTIPLAPAVAVERQAITNELLELATEDIPVDERLERLDHAMRDLVDEEPKMEVFIKDAAQMAAKVATGDMTMAVARKWLEERK